MAAVSAAILCDFAQVREGLLFVNSGGITRAFAEQVPAPLNMMLGLIVELGPAEAEAAHELVVTVKHVESAGVLARLVGGLQARDAVRFPGEGLYVPLALDLRAVAVTSYGAHDVQTEVDGNVGPTLTCYFVDHPVHR